jgi:hypothetical protein
MGLFKRFMGLDVVDTALHVAATLFTAYLGTELIAPGRADDGIVLAAVFGASTIYYAVRRREAMQARPPETTGEAAALRQQELEARLAELELNQHRVAELEERLDFAERLLAQRAEAVRLEGEPR